MIGKVVAASGLLIPSPPNDSTPFREIPGLRDLNVDIHSKLRPAYEKSLANLRSIRAQFESRKDGVDYSDTIEFLKKSEKWTEDQIKTLDIQFCSPADIFCWLGRRTRAIVQPYVLDGGGPGLRPGC